MSARPERRKSSLAGESPIAPVVIAPPAPQAAPASSSLPATPVSSGDAVTSPAAARKHPPKVSIYQDIEDTDRMRGAIVGTIPWEGFRTLSTFLGGAGMAEVERLERKYNDGKPFPPVGAREMPQGRPMGA